MATFGKTVAGSTSEGWYVNYVWANLYSLPADGTVSSMSFYCTTGTSHTFKCAIFSASGTFTKLGETASGDMPAGAPAWVTVDMTSPLELSAGDYYLCVIVSGGTIYRDAEGISLYYEANTYPNFPADVGTSWASNYGTHSLSLYATYEEASASNVVMNVI